MVALDNLQLDGRHLGEAKKWKSRLCQKQPLLELPRIQPPLDGEPVTGADHGSETLVLTGAKAERRVAESPARKRFTDTSAAITLYVREVGQVKPLTPRAEFDLIARIKRGDR